MVFSRSVVSESAAPWVAARQASLSSTISWSSLKLLSIESVMPPSHLILCRPLLLLPSIFPSIRVLSNESALHTRLLKYWSLSFSNSPSNEYSGLISFGIDWLDLLVVQGTLKNLFQHHSLKAPILRRSASSWVERKQWPPYFPCSFLLHLVFVRDHCKLSGLNQCRPILPMSGGQKSKIKASAGLVPWGG